MADLHFPTLDEPYNTALRAAVTYILDTFEPLGIIASGTIIRGNPGPSSDLDLYVIHGELWRQRVQRWFDGVPAEIFINPPDAVWGYFESEVRDARLLTAHMLATGVVILDESPVIEELRSWARTMLQAQPNPSAERLVQMRYLVAAEFEDARDVAGTDPLTARLILAKAVHGMLHVAFWKANRFIPREKDLLATLADLDAPLGELARTFWSTNDLTQQIELAGQIADRTIGARGFFEWESTPEEVTPPA
ncbi:MAG: hypothetical protein JXQ72_11985 [Anaerolineae bacterium]|nr:hypothetical protein [Anaerolineae bacterium]